MFAGLISSVPPLSLDKMRNSNDGRCVASSPDGDRSIALGLILLGFLMRAVALPASLWEWDDVLFARALHRFDVSASSPHPPGFPVFVLLGRVAYFLVGD